MSAIEIDPKATPDEILAAWKDAQLKQGLDPNASFVEAFSKHPSATAVEPSRQASARTVTEPAAQTFKREVQINGRDFEFEAGSEAELNQMIINAYQLAENLRPETTTSAQAQQVDPAEQAVDRFDLDRKFRRGEISTKDYLEKSGAVNELLASQGIPVEELRAQVEQRREATLQKSWESATSAFLQNSDWPGGEQNKQILTLTLERLGLADADDKLSALQQAYAEMKRTGLVFPQQAQQTQSRESNGRFASQQRQSSGLFGSSSGVADSDYTQTADPNAKVEIPANATPGEILEAWKRDQLKKGIDPNATFVETFSRKK
jgi:hypothetical protein